MKAAFIERHGGPEVLKFGDMPDPVAASGEIVVNKRPRVTPPPLGRSIA
jgi:NADPH:quinone reductase-like Zn-dependent oxidoreductase